MNVKDLEDHLFYILQNSLNELSHTENIDVEKIEKLFNRTIQESLTTLSEALEKVYQEDYCRKMFKRFRTSFKISARIR